MLFDNGGGVGVVYVAQLNTQVMYAVGHRKTLHVEEVEMILVGRCDTRALEFVFFHKLDGVILAYCDYYLHFSLVAVTGLDEVEVPGIKREIGLYIRACSRLVEGAV